MSQNFGASTVKAAAGGLGFAISSAQGFSGAGLLGVATNQAGVTTSAGLATTYTGLLLANPAGSGKNLSLIRVAANFNVAFAALTGVFLLAGSSALTTTTAVTVQNARIAGASNPTLAGLAYSAATLGAAPVYLRPLAESPPTTNGLGFDALINGEITIAPGGFVAIGTTVASPASALFGSFIWEEGAV